MVEASSMYSNLDNQLEFRLNKINKVKDYFIAEIRERELMSKRLGKYFPSFDSSDKSLIVLSLIVATSGSVSIASFASIASFVLLVNL